MNERGGEGFLTHAEEQRLRAKLTAAEDSRNTWKDQAETQARLANILNGKCGRAEQLLERQKELVVAARRVDACFDSLREWPSTTEQGAEEEAALDDLHEALGTMERT